MLCIEVRVVAKVADVTQGVHDVSGIAGGEPSGRLRAAARIPECLLKLLGYGVLSTVSSFLLTLLCGGMQCAADVSMSVFWQVNGRDVNGTVL
jgi:hypothetical protein